MNQYFKKVSSIFILLVFSSERAFERNVGGKLIIKNNQSSAL